jgi:MFS family permease
MLSPIMPLFLPVLGVSSAGAVALWAGILAGTTSLVAAFASPLWGRLADRHGRKLMLLRSSIAVGVFAALMGAATNVWQSTAIALVASQVPEPPSPTAKPPPSGCGSGCSGRARGDNFWDWLLGSYRGIDADRETRIKV